MTAEQIWADLRTLLLEKADPHRTVVDGTGMSFFRTKILRRLLAGPCSAGELAKRLRSDAPYISLTLRDLEERGFLARTEDPADRRRRIIELTDAGREIAERAEKILKTPPDAMAELTDEELATLGALVRKLLA